MKIAYVLNTYPQPSHSFIRREVQALERQGVEISRIAMRASDSPLVDPQDRAEADKTHYVLQQGGSRLMASALKESWANPRGVWAALRQAVRLGRASDRGVVRHLIYLVEAIHVKRRCAALGVDHLHAHFGTNATAVAMLVRALGGATYSFTTHGPEEFDAPQALSLGAKATAAEFAVAISSFGRSQLCRWVAFDHWSKLKVVHCGIEPGKFADPQPIPDGPMRLVAIGRFAEQKGQMVLVQAMAELVSEHPDLHLSLVGDGDMRPDLEAAIHAADLGRNITLTGWLSEAEVQQQLAAAHALVMPSFAEGLPMVVMEAMAAARPVIATYVAGTPELVQPGQTGWLVPAGDVGAFATAISDLIATPHATLEQMGQAGRQRVFARHDSDAEAAKLCGYFAEALAAR